MPASGPALLFPCSGASDVGALADLGARAVSRGGQAKIFCLAQIAAGYEDALAKARETGRLVAIDGCEKSCAFLVLQKAGLANITHVCLTQLGLPKGYSPMTLDRVETVRAEIVDRLSPNHRTA